MSRQVVLFIVGVALFASSIARPSDIDSEEFATEWEGQGRIVGGNDAARGQFPHQVSLRVRASHRHNCGGSIISERFILTAAHCTPQGMPAKHYYVVVGATLVKNDGVDYDLEALFPHPEYSTRQRENDVSVLRTVKSIEFNALVAPTKLPFSQPPVEGNLATVVSGWGKAKVSFLPAISNSVVFRLLSTAFLQSIFPPEHLQYLDTVTLSHDECVKQLDQQGHMVGKKNVCTTSPESRGACFGDSGGALIDGNNTQIGIVSWGVPCARGKPDVYAQVFAHLPYIQSIIAKYE